VLLGVESDVDWRKHYDGICRALNPGNEFEADLVYLIAWQLWRFGRLIRHETALTNQKIHEPSASIFDLENNLTVTKEAILDAIVRLECHSSAWRPERVRTRWRKRNLAISAVGRGTPRISTLCCTTGSLKATAQPS
jgi:hypothetical protein